MDRADWWDESGNEWDVSAPISGPFLGHSVLSVMSRTITVRIREGLKRYTGMTDEQMAVGPGLSLAAL